MYRRIENKKFIQRHSYIRAVYENEKGASYKVEERLGCGLTGRGVKLVPFVHAYIYSNFANYSTNKTFSVWKNLVEFPSCFQKTIYTAMKTSFYPFQAETFTHSLPHNLFCMPPSFYLIPYQACTPTLVAFYFQQVSTSENLPTEMKSDS